MSKTKDEAMTTMQVVEEIRTQEEFQPKGKAPLSATEEIDALVKRSKKALTKLETMTQEEIDYIVHRMAIAGLDAHMRLAKLAIEETKRGVYEDKALKNMFATESIWHNIRHNKTCGIIEDHEVDELVRIAVPVGVVCAVTPVTNPTSTTLFKALICLKTRNPVIFSFHPSAQKCSAEAARVVYEAAVAAGAPEDCILWIEETTLEKSGLLMNHPDVAVVLATGGSAMVKAAYSTGKPALGVGPGNVPSYIEKTAHIKQAVNDVVVSKTFDNGMICASEQGVIVDDEIYDAVKAEFIYHGAYFVKPEDIASLEMVMLNDNKQGVRGAIPGQSAVHIAELAGIEVPPKTKLLIVELDGVGPQYPLSQEKLSPVLAMFRSHSHEEGLSLCEAMLDFGGLGHSAAIHSYDDDLIEQFGIRMKACRILVNSPSSQGGIGDMYNNNIPSLTLGCGSYGKNSVSKNVTTVDLITTKTIAKRRNNMQWIKLPPKVYFEADSISYLRTMPDMKRVFIVADTGMVKLGFVNRIVEELKRRPNKIEYAVFADVEPDPSTNTVYKGVEKMTDFNPDTVIALGGGSVMDAAKVIWLFSEHPETDFFGAKQKYLDIRKRTYRIAPMTQAKLVCIPTTSGTGSEVTPFAVITDSDTGVKYPLADYALTPTVAIVDPTFVYKIPKALVGETGIDVLSHAIESYVSVMASDFTKGLSLQAIKMVFDYLPASYQNGNREAREKMHNAATIAGMAFANALLGINHSIAHKLGGVWHMPHGRCIAMSMPHVIRYNAKEPTKHAMWAKYNYFRADEDYAEIARYLGLKGHTTAELVEALIEAIYELAAKVDVKMGLKEYGVTREDFEAHVDELAELAFEDQCTSTNPKEPLISEIKAILEATYEGKA